MAIPIPDDEPRSEEELRRQFQVERELAQRLLSAPREARRSLYSAVYDEFLQRVPQQPLAQQKADPAAQGHLVALQAQLLEPFLTPTTTFLEVGSGDSCLAVSLAARVREVIAVEASEAMAQGLQPPENFRLVVADAPPYGIPAASVDLAFSCHFIEHVHPEDALEHAAEVHRLLVPGGHYVVVTPNRLLGPHDISKYFARRAQGLHLKEYTHTDLAVLLRRAGFQRVEVLKGIGQPPVRVPLAQYRLAEATTGALPAGVRHRVLERLADRWGLHPPFRPLEQVKLVATR
jgi:SAM-dependent methyltransferase